MFKRILDFFGWRKNSEEKDIDTMKKFLVVGLGNIGEKYQDTRHNIGFNVLDTLASEEAVSFSTVKLGDTATFKIKGRNVLLLKPNTYMNLSGKALKYWMDKEKIPIENVLVVTDDLNLNFGALRIKTKGSDGGHNGLKDIQDKLQTPKYNRFRFGIGNSYNKVRQIDFVLGKWNEEEQSQLKERIETATKAIRSFVLSGATITMNTFNGK